MQNAQAQVLPFPKTRRLPEGRQAQLEKLPLCVGLNGSLLAADPVDECLVGLLRHKPLVLLQAVWQTRGERSALRQRLGQECELDVASLPFNTAVLRYVEQQKGNGRRVVLATAIHRTVAERIADHLGVFDEVLAADALNSEEKTIAEALVGRFGAGGYSYIGAAECDLPVWESAAEALLVNPSGRLEAKARAAAFVSCVFGNRDGRLTSLLKALRSAQWAKNLLVFVPAFAAVPWTDPAAMLAAAFMFVAFCLAASGSYIINDLIDIAADRRHSRKRTRPFAGGQLPLRYGVLGPAFIGAGILLAATLSLLAGLAIVLFAGIATAYSFWLKRKPLADVLSLASLYAVRLLGGAIACGLMVSSWLVVVSGFLFLALALIKRAAELQETDTTIAEGPALGYGSANVGRVCAIGVFSSVIAILVLALYIDSAALSGVYLEPLSLWLAVPAMLCWQCRLWLAATRGTMHTDPIVYTARDPVSWGCFGIVAVAYLIAVGSIGLLPGASAPA
ncbi:hypothetical protein CAI21_11250 [Alkalilimnicola ehrlichii]|uniref:UbiA prenyltransferase n=1 Tax=Alkalilimnicola ehrlichii TaxID=351052 RepID=A0A3E0X2R6_9GAMM|nr:UbiA family prenyltransferase [Alkalilimnicola ehrlichii]RFA29017.1 hypothetical protein CAI21_11250 [Alkalilimnicola ehrlichii]RFA38652.1 hypothetical protein CAL65_04800 [Alkalilimnicola ehrlichii]